MNRSPEARYVLLSRANCHLCDEMRDVLEKGLPRYGERFVVRNVDDSIEWRERFGEVVPVLLRDGQVVAKIRLSPDRLERIVAGNRRTGKP